MMRKEQQVMHKIDVNRALWAALAVLALVAAGSGVADPRIYAKVVDLTNTPGAIAQDIMTIPAALVLLVIAALSGESRAGESGSRSVGLKRQIVALGIVGYFFYGYGIASMERLYTGLYLVYLAIFGLSFWTLVYGVSHIRREVLEEVQLPDSVRWVSFAITLLQPVIFYPMWISQLLPLMAAGRKIEFLYSIYVLDLCFIMPAFLILAYLLWRRSGYGLLLTPAILILGFVELMPLGFAELVKPSLGVPMTATGGMLAFSFALPAVFLALGVVHLRALKP
jgi:hypothetical protein